MADKKINLQYYITCPDVNFVYENQSSSIEDFVFIEKHENVPIIVLFGWSGASDKYLKIYSKIYEEKGLITLRHICPLKILFWRQDHMSLYADKLFRLLNEPDFQNRPIIVHLFSNGGAFQYEFFKKSLEENFRSKQIKGVIFDSAPGKMTFFNGLGAINSMIGKEHQVLAYPIAFLITVFIFTMKLLRDLSGHIIGRDFYEMNPIEHLKNEENVCPQHFIYSKADNLVDYQDVQYFMKHRKHLGVEVTSDLYKDTPHVRHFPSDRLRYTRGIINFVNNCLRK